MDPSSILVLRTSALGDVVHARPVLSALREAFPDARLGWVIEKPFAPIVRDHPALDTVIPVRLRAWRRSLHTSTHEMRNAWRQLRSFRADVALDLMGNHKSGLLARASGASLRIGPRRPDRREPGSSLWINHPLPLVGDHAVDRSSSLLAGLGIPHPRIDFDPGSILGLPDAEADALLPDRPHLLVQPGAGWANKRYPSEAWGEVVRELVAEGWVVHVLAGPDEIPLAREVVSAAGTTSRVLSGSGLPYLISALRRAELVLGGDTGPLHLAHALGTPVLAVMGPTDPRRHGPYGALERVVVHRLPCSFCSRRLAEPKACLRSIPPSLVVARALEILGRGPAARD